MNVRTMVLALAAAAAGAAAAVTLPAGYAELAYTVLNAQQYLDTGIVPSGHEVDVDFQTTTYASDGMILGQDEAWYCFYFNEYNGHYTLGRSAQGNGVTVSSPLPDLKRHSLVFNRADDYAVLLDGVELCSGTKAVSTRNLLLGRRSGTTKYYGRYFSCAVIEHASGDTVRNFVPAKNASGVAGFYDTVEGKFYTSATSTAFVGGPERWDFSVSPIPEQTITIGDEARPRVVVTNALGDTELVLGEDYTVTYRDNTTAGAASVVVTGLGDYAGYAHTVYFLLEVSYPSATVRTWTGGSGTFETAAQWDPAGVPSDGETAIVTNTDEAAVITVSTALDIGRLELGGGAGSGSVKIVFANGLTTNRVSGSVILKSGATLTHTAGASGSGVQSYALNLKVGGNIKVESGASVDANLCGYATGCGPGGTWSAGGSYGGVGWGGKPSYGSIREPTDLGSGGDGSRGGSRWGGGAIYLDAEGVISVEGTVMACGCSSSNGGGGCGAAGGSIFLKCGLLSGTGVVKADHSADYPTASYGGGGGRVAIHQRTATDWSNWKGSVSAINGGHGGPGTLFWKLPTQTYGSLVVNGRTTSNAPICDLSTSIRDLDQPFDTVAVSNSIQFLIRSGVTLKVAGLVDTRNGKFQAEDATAVVAFTGAGDATWLGCNNSTLYGLTCTTPGKRIFFGTASSDALTLGANGKLTLTGTEAAPIELLPLDGTGTWKLTLDTDTLQDVSCVAVSNSNASAGSAIVDMSGTDLGGNANWFFVEPAVPGETNLWTGANSALWSDPANWSCHRFPVETDVVRIGASSAGNYPTISLAEVGYDTVIVDAGATLTLAGTAVTVSNDLRVAGTLVCSGAQTIQALGTVDFTDGAFACGTSTLVISNAAATAFNPNGQTFHALVFPDGGGDVTFADSLTATSLVVRTTAARTLTFAAGKLVTAPELTLDGYSNATKLLTLASSAPGTAWRLKATNGGMTVTGVRVSDSDASAGDSVRVDKKCEDLGRNTNWIFPATTTTYTWNGGSGAWTDGNWTVEGDNVSAYPNSAKDYVVIPRADTDFTITVSDAINVGVLEVASGTGTAQAKLLFANGLSTNAVASDVRLYAGAYLYHQDNTTSKQYVLNLKVGGVMTVDADATVAADCSGFSQNGPGASGAGGSYGGYGWNNATSPYGSIKEPTDLGSNGASGRTWAGGGAIYLDVTGDLTVNGTIEAQGGLQSAGGGGCGGSGGSVFLKMATLRGAGNINANQTRFHPANYSGSGGRVAIHQSTGTDWSAFTGTITAYGGVRSPSGYNGGAAGTIFKKTAGQTYGDLYVTGSYTATGQCRTTPILATMVESDRIFDHVTVTDYAYLEIGAGATLKVMQGANARTGGIVCADTTAVLELCGNDDFTWLGSSYNTLYNVTCTVPGKKIYFGTTSSDNLVIPASGALTLKGDAENPLYLLPLDGTATWTMNLNADASSDIEYVAVSNSNASAGASVLAIDSQDLGGNTYWGFSERIRPGQTIDWTGASSTAWADAANWSRGRTPVETDIVNVDVVASGNYPVLSSGNNTFNQVHVKSGATVTLNGANLIVTNGFTVAGALVCSGTEKVTLSCDASFAGGTLTAGRSYFILTGATDQAIDPAGLVFNKVYVNKTGGTVTFADGFTAAQLRATATDPVTLAFAAGKTVTAGECYLNGLVGSTRCLTLASAESGTVWKFKVTANRHAVVGANVSDSDASSGAKVVAGSSNANGGNNANWDFATSVAFWTGAVDTDWATSANWAGGTVPADGDSVTIVAADGATVSVKVPATHPVKLNVLDLGVTDGTVKFTSDAKVEIASDFEIRKSVTVSLNEYDEANVVSGSVTVRAGGTLTHDQLKKLNLKVAGDMTVDASGLVHANRKGYAPGKCYLGTHTSTLGGVYAGWAGEAGTLKYVMGSVFTPTDWGCGGYNEKYGGGVILLDVAGTLTVNGIVESCGTYGGGGGWSGAGGSILLKVGTLAGAGKIRACAVETASQSDYNNQYTGSGGRVALYQRTATDWSAYTGTVEAKSGDGADACSGAGTVYRQCANEGDGHGEIIVDSYNTAGSTLLPAPDDAIGDYRHARLVIKAGVVEITNSTWNVTRDRLVLRDLNLSGASARLKLQGSTVRVNGAEHRDAKGWAGTYADLVTEAGGTVIWAGGTTAVIR